MTSKELNHRLLQAIQKGNLEEVSSILRNNSSNSNASSINLNSSTSSGKTALMLSAEIGRVDILKLLLQTHQCHINHQSHSAQNALHLAAKSSSAECCSELLKAGCDVTCKDHHGNTPLIAAAQIWPPRTHALQLLAQNWPAGMSFVNSQGRTALHYTSHQAIGTKTLLQLGADPDVQDDAGNTAGHLAAIEGFDAVVRCLWEHGCDINLKNHLGKSVVHYLALRGRWELIREIEWRGNFELIDEDGNTPLLLAVKNKQVLTCVELLKHHCDPGWRGREGWSYIDAVLYGWASGKNSNREYDPISGEINNSHTSIVNNNTNVLIATRPNFDVVSHNNATNATSLQIIQTLILFGTSPRALFAIRHPSWKELLCGGKAGCPRGSISSASQGNNNHTNTEDTTTCFSTNLIHYLSHNTTDHFIQTLTNPSSLKHLARLSIRQTIRKCLNCPNNGNSDHESSDDPSATYLTEMSKCPNAIVSNNDYESLDNGFNRITSDSAKKNNKNRNYKNPPYHHLLQALPSYLIDYVTFKHYSTDTIWEAEQ